jgi:general secretion pathway protein L
MNLNKEISLNPAAFFQWWGEGLMAWLPDNLWDWLFDRAEDVLLKVDSERLHLYQRQSGQEQLLATIALSELADGYSKLLQKYPELEKGRFILCLNNQQAIQKVVLLPAAVKDNLAQVMAYELDKYTPFNSEQVYFSTQIISQAADGQLEVLLVLTPRPILDELLQILTAAKIQVDQVLHENKRVEPVGYNLLPADQQRQKNRFSRMLIIGLSVMASLLLMALLLFPVVTGQNQVDELKRKISALSQQTQQVQWQHRQMDQLQAQAEQIVELKQAQPFLNPILNELTRLLPDNTWLSHFKFQQGKIQIQGQSGTASSLIETLENSLLFENVRFVSPLTQDKRTGLERFRISMEVVGKGEHYGE